MDNFDSTLLRLKEQLSVHTDKEVAGLLGLSVKAFTARKMRGAFPVDKLMALKAAMPKLNVEYVLSGDLDALLHQKIQGDLDRANQAVGHSVLDRSAEYVVDSSSQRSAALVGDFELLDEVGKQAIESMMKALLIKK